MVAAKKAKPQTGAPGPAGSGERFALRLYVSGMAPSSVRAVSNLKALCEEHFPGRYDLEVVDVFQQPELARADQIVAVPTLIKKLPTPIRRLIGDLSIKERVVVEFDLLETP